MAGTDIRPMKWLRGTKRETKGVRHTNYGEEERQGIENEKGEKERKKRNGEKQNRKKREKKEKDQD